MRLGLRAWWDWCVVHDAVAGRAIDSWTRGRPGALYMTQPSDQYQPDHTDQDQNQEDQEVSSADLYPVLAAVEAIDLVDLVVVSSVD